MNIQEMISAGLDALAALPPGAFQAVIVLLSASAVLGWMILARPRRLPWCFSGKVTWVCDGDSVYVNTRWGQRVKLRLLGIDAPETEQPYGNESREYLRRLIDGRRVEVRAMYTDLYGRYVSAVLLNGEDVCLAMIREGLAWPYFQFLNQLPQGTAMLYRQTGFEAKRARRGLWSLKHVQAPWDWRREHRTYWRRERRTWWQKFWLWLRMLFGR